MKMKMKQLLKIAIDKMSISAGIIAVVLLIK